jgi:glycosyltransferase involved in cell wall biosynthesis
MKIAIITGIFLPKWVGGTELATRDIARHLAARGHSVHILTSVDETAPERSVETGVTVHRIYLPKLRYFGFPIFCLRLVSRLKKIDPQIVHIQSFLMAVCGLLAKKLLGKPYVVWSQGYGYMSSHRTYVTIMLKDADAVIALSDHMKEELQRMWPRDISTIPNGIDLQRFERVSHDAARNHLGIGEDERIVLYVGRLDSAKGLPILSTRLHS